MSYTKQRFMVNPLATADNITASSQGAGTVAGAKKTGTGSATLTSSGAYTGAGDVLVTVQIDALGTGEIASSTYRWKTSDTAAGTWEASGQATGTITITLGSEGLQIIFAGGTGADFVLDDKWQFWAYAGYGPANLFVNDRDKFWKTAVATPASNIVIDLGSAQTINTCILADHNLTSSATVTLSGNATDSWGSPSYSLAILSSANTDPSVNYISESYRYWRLLFDDTSNPDGFISIGKLYLGTYTELQKVNINLDWGSVRSNARTRLRNVSNAGKSLAKTLSDGETFPTGYTFAPDADEATLRSIYDYTYKTGATIYGNDKSIWLHYFNDIESLCFLCECMTEQYDVTYSYLDLKKTLLTWRQEIMTRVP